MTFGEDTGPKEVVIPEQRFYSCIGCKYYESQMVKSGDRPLFSHTCKALDIAGNPSSENTILCYELYDEKTPDFCPYLKSQKRNDQIDKIV